jgi:hypothetical protein
MANSTTHRPHHSHRRHSTRPQILRPTRDHAEREAAIAAARSALEKAGLGLAELDARRSRSRANLRTALAAYRAEADQRAPAMQKEVARSAEHWLRGKRLVPADAPSSGFYALSTADAITATTNINFISQTIAPFANTAEITVEQQAGDDVGSVDELLEFLFSWQNPTGQDLTCTLTAVLGVTATAIVTADSYWWPLDPTTPVSELDVFASLGVTLVDAFGEITSLPFQSTQIQEVADLLVSGGWTEGTIAGQDIFRGYVLQYVDALVPAGARLDLSVNCEVYWLALDGGCQFVAAGNKRKLESFGIFLDAEPAPAA